MRSSIKHKIILKAMILITLMISTLNIQAQDGHYWSDQYGTRSMMLSGAVIGSVQDLGAVFYNPARIGVVKNSAFLISADVYEYSRLVIKDALGDNLDLSKSDFSGAPGLVAGKIKHKILGKHKLAYAFISRHRSNNDFFVRTETVGDVAPSIPGDEIFAGSIRLAKNIKEEWVGLAWAYPFTDHFSVGASGFWASRSQSSLYNLQLQAMALNDTSVAILIRDRELNYKTNGLVWKFGMSWDYENMSFGVTVTAPKIRLNGDGNYLYEEFLIGVDTTGNGIPDDHYTSNIQDGLDAQDKSPWAIGIGTGFKVGKKKRTMIHLSAEWYNKLDLYTLMESEVFNSQSTGVAINTELVDELNHVINFGTGIELFLSDKLTNFYSYSTNFSAVNTNVSSFASLEETTNNTVVKADFNNLAGGFSFNANKVEINLGAGYSFGKQTIKRPVDFPLDSTDQDEIFQADEVSRLRIEKWRFFIGISIPFVDKVRDELGI